MARLDKLPEIVQVLDFFPANNTAYLVMEYLEGTNLRSILSEQGRIPAKHLFRMMEPVLKAMNTMHNAGVIHRDISPDNMLLLADGKLKLLDFGCARDIDTEHSMTVMLKHGYAPMEQYTGYNQGPWTDVYALSATIYHCLTGRTPPPALERINNQDPLIPPNKLGAALTPDQEQALLRGLAVEPQKRWQSLAGLYAALYSTVVKGYPWTPRPDEQKTEIIYPNVSYAGRKNPSAGTPVPEKSEPRMEQKAEASGMPNPNSKKKDINFNWKGIIVVAAVAIPLILGVVSRNLSGLLINTKKQSDNEQEQVIASEQEPTILPKEEQNASYDPPDVEEQQDKDVIAIENDNIISKSLRNTIAAGSWHTVGLKTDGTVVATGQAVDGQCNVDDWRDIIEVGAGTMFTVGLREDGTVVTTTGYNWTGGGIDDSWTDIVSISCSSHGVVGLKSDGTVLATADKYYSDDVYSGVSSWTDIIAVSAGDAHVVGLKSDNTVVAVGPNDYSECNVENWTDIIAISAGEDCTVGLRADGTVVYAGEPSEDMEALKNWTDIVAISVNRVYVAGLRADGTVLLNREPPHNVYVNGDVRVEANIEQCMEDINSWTDIVAVATSFFGNFTIGLKADGTMVAADIFDGIDDSCNVEDWTDIRVDAD